MLRSPNPNISIIDKANYLWMLCTLEWLIEHGESSSNITLRRLFDEETKDKFNFYRSIAVERKDIAPGGTKLTPKGQRIVDSWRRISDYIFDVS